jgi:hypothetical protein
MEGLVEVCSKSVQVKETRKSERRIMGATFPDCFWAFHSSQCVTARTGDSFENGSFGEIEMGADHEKIWELVGEHFEDTKDADSRLFIDYGIDTNPELNEPQHCHDFYC